MSALQDKGKSQLIDDLNMGDISFQQRVLSRLMAAKATQKTFQFRENTLAQASELTLDNQEESKRQKIEAA